MKNKVQNAVIALLSATAILLFVLTAVSERGLFFSPASTDGTQNESGSTGPLMPVAAVLNDGDCSLLGKNRLLTPYFEVVRPILVELLGSANAPAQVDPARWVAALNGKGVLLDYGAVLPVAVIGGSEEGPLTELYADSLLITLTKELAELYLYADGVCYMSTTALKTADLEPRLLGSEGEAVVYACTLGKTGTALTPHSAVPIAAQAAGVLTRTPLCDENGSYERERQMILLEAFGFDSYTARSYADASSGRVFLAEGGTLRAGGDGSLTFVAADEAAVAAMLGDSAACVDRASAILADCIAGLTNVPRYVLSAVETQGDRTIASFDAWYDGVVLVASNGSRTAARFVFQGDLLVQAEVALFAVSVSETDAAAPQLNPQALLAGLTGDGSSGRLSWAYLERGNAWQAAFCVLPVVRGGNGADIHG
ncbi:MAG: hypothetical protein IKC99_03810 [Clostridia bacterium]|nr:hypothetical protein [Clostridia bacterium]